MSPEDARRTEVRDWLGKAHKDLAAAEALLRMSPPFVEQAVFFCQQAAEKALKAFLTWHGATFTKTHDIEVLGQASLAFAPDLDDVVIDAETLTPYAWRFRYQVHRRGRPPRRPSRPWKWRLGSSTP